MSEPKAPLPIESSVHEHVASEVHPKGVFRKGRLLVYDFCQRCRDRGCQAESLAWWQCCRKGIPLKTNLSSHADKCLQHLTCNYRLDCRDHQGWAQAINGPPHNHVPVAEGERHPCSGDAGQHGAHSHNACAVYLHADQVCGYERCECLQMHRHCA